MSNALDNLPVDLARQRVLGSADAAAFCNMSSKQLRRLTLAGKAPSPIKLGERKLGWRLGDLIDWTSRSETREAA